ncbi:hypothetical protein D3C80_1834610 [compost metagenome]
MLDVDIELASLECFEGHPAVTVELHLDPIEVVLAPVDRQVLAPPILDAFEHQASAGLYFADPVRAAAQGRLEGSGLEVAGFPVVAW